TRLEVNEALAAGKLAVSGAPEHLGELGRVARCDDDHIEQAVMPGAGGLRRKREAERYPAREQLADVGNHDGYRLHIDLATISGDVEPARLGAQRFLHRCVDVRAEAPAFLEVARGGMHDLGVEPRAGDECERAVVDASEIDTGCVAEDGDIHCVRERPRNAEVVRYLVGRAARDDGEWRVRAGQTGGNLRE